MRDKDNETCKYCHKPVGDEYLVNQYGDYFCNDDCYDNYYNQDIPEVMNLQSDDTHPYIDDYQAIRRHYLDWRSWKKQLDAEEHFAWLVVNDMLDDLDRVMEPFMDFYFREGDDGVFAWEIYQYVLKLQEIQKEIVRWHPDNRTLYYAFYIQSDSLNGEALEGKLMQCLIEEQDNVTLNLLRENRHPCRIDPEYVFEYESDRQEVLDMLEEILAANGMEAVLYEAHLCDAECGDYLDRGDSNYWHDGWFYCDSCTDYWKYIGYYDSKELEKDIKYYEENPDDLVKDSRDEYWVRYTAKIRRSCLLLNVEIPEWV